MFFTVGTDWKTYTFETGYLKADSENGISIVDKLSDLELKEFSAEESMRLFYVAVTRAKKKLYITAPLKVKSFNKEVEQEPSIIFDSLF